VMSFVNHNGGGPVTAVAARGQQGRKHNKHEDEEAGKVFVGGLSWETTQDNLLGYFSRFGEVIDCVVMKNAETGRSRGFGFVTFSDPGNIDAVVANCPHTLDGRTIDPKPCNPRSMQKPKKTTVFPKVFLGGLPSSITETDLRAFFSRYGEVFVVVIMYDQEKKKARGFGFLSFTTEDAVDRAVVEHYVNIQNKQVEIKRAEPRTNTDQQQTTQLLTNGVCPVVDQWGGAAPTNGVHATPPATAYSGWGGETINFTQPAPAYWGSPPPVTQPSPQGWGAPPPPLHHPQHTSYQTIQHSQPIQYNSHTHYISPNPPSAAPSFTASYWGSPPGPTPPPSTPQEMYSPHAVSPQSPPQPKFDIGVPTHGTFHVHPAPPPGHAEYARIYQKAGGPPTQLTTATPHEFYATSPAVAVTQVGYGPPPPDQQRMGGMPGTYAPPPQQINSYHAFRRT